MSCRARSVALVVCTALLLLLGGCAGSSSESADPAPTVQPEPTVEAEPTPEPTVEVEPTVEAEPTPTPEPTATAIPEPTAVPVTPLALNHVQVIGSHNSYHRLPPPAIFNVLQALSPELAASREYEHRSLTEQLETFGVRQLELDVYADPVGGLFANPAANLLVGLPPLDAPELAEPGFKVLHVQDYDYVATCLTLVLCLEEVASWSSATPTHLPLVILIEFKSQSVPDAAEQEGVELPELAWTTPLAPTAELLRDLDAEIRSVFDADQLIAPDDVRAGAATLEDAVITNGWPTVDESRGSVMFALTGGAVRDLYRADDESLAGRPMFTNSQPGEADAAFMLIDDPSDPGLEAAVEAGYLVRTRTDVPTNDARTNNRTRLETATASGAHFLSTDYYAPSELFDSPYVAALPGDQIARCNPVTAPPTCTDDQLAE